MHMSERGDRMANGIFACMMAAGLLYALVTGRGAYMGSALLQSAQQALETVWDMAGGLMFFCGILEILRQSGAMKRWTALMKKPLGKLFGSLPGDALEYVTVNLLSNMLGMGNAATPAGIRAMQYMARGERATDAMCLFLVINASSVQLMPTTLIALRQAAGSQNPESIVLPSLIATAASTLGGILACKVMEKIR